MGYLVAGFLGVLLGAWAAAGTVFLVLRKMVDRDLAERRLRALASLHEALGPRPDDGALSLEDPRAAEQMGRDVEAAARDFRLIAWIFDEPVRSDLAGAVEACDAEARRARNGAAGASSFRLVDARHQLDLALAQAAARTLREFRSWRFLSSRREPPDPAPLNGMSNGTEGLLREDPVAPDLPAR